MEFLDSVWQIGIIALVAGAMIGALAYRLLSPSVKDADKIKTELDDARQELNSYKASVSQHFGKTAELVNDLTQDYVRVYQHLAEGAQTLGDSKTFDNLLEQHQGRVSITVDEQTGAADKLADDLVAEQTVAQAQPEATVDEHAEPFVGGIAGATESADSDPDTAKAGSPGSEGKADAAAEVGEPVVNIDALEQATGKPAAETRADAPVTVAEGEAKVEVRTTTH